MQVKSLESQIKEAKDKLSELEAKLELVKTPIRVAMREPYFYVDSCGFPCSAYDFQVNSDNLRYQHGNYFLTEEAAVKGGKRMTELFKALRSGGEVDIEVLIPLLRDGWVAMDKNNTWCWFESEPVRNSTTWDSYDRFIPLAAFTIKPTADWKRSLKKC